LYRQFVELEEENSANPFLAAVDGFFLNCQKFISEMKLRSGTPEKKTEGVAASDACL
jgi:hypothetical protein